VITFYRALFIALVAISELLSVEVMAGAAKLRLQPIIVHDLNHEQNSQSVPVAVSSFHVDQLDDSGETNFRHLEMVMPSLIVAPIYPLCRLTVTGNVHLQ